MAASRARPFVAPETGLGAGLGPGLGAGLDPGGSRARAALRQPLQTILAFFHTMARGTAWILAIGLGLVVAIGLAFVVARGLSAVSGTSEPDAQAIRQGLEYVHKEWVDQQRRARHDAESGLLAGVPRVDLGFEARLDLRITDVKKLGCKPAPVDKLGYVCQAEVSATTAGRQAVIRRIEGRFMTGYAGWVARDVHPVD